MWLLNQVRCFAEERVDFNPCRDVKDVNVKEILRWNRPHRSLKR